jgi:hypothetical protein
LRTGARMTAIPSARFVLPALIVFWLVVAVLAYSL